jgi:hypothetical protein
MTADEKQLTLKWISCWHDAGSRLEKMRHNHIKTCNTAHAIKILDDAFKATLQNHITKPYSGLIHQQKLFSKLRA